MAALQSAGYEATAIIGAVVPKSAVTGGGSPSDPVCVRLLA